MISSWNISLYVFFLYLCFQRNCYFLNPVHAKDVNPVFENLLTRLHMDDMDEEYLQDIFTRPELELMYKVVALSLTRKRPILTMPNFSQKTQ